MAPSISAGKDCIHTLKDKMPCGLTIEVDMGNASPRLGLWPAHVRTISARMSWLSLYLMQ